MKRVAVMRDRYVRAWPRHETGERVFNLELRAALERDYTSDAHFVAYPSPNGRRLRREAIGTVPIELVVIVFDVDCPEVHGTKEPAPQAWRSQQRERESFDLQKSTRAPATTKPAAGRASSGRNRIR